MSLIWTLYFVLVHGFQKNAFAVETTKSSPYFHVLSEKNPPNIRCGKHDTVTADEYIHVDCENLQAYRSFKVFQHVSKSNHTDFLSILELLTNILHGYIDHERNQDEHMISW